jgi:hypothetical protein
MIQCPHCQVEVQPCRLLIHLRRWCKAQNTIYANALEKRRERAQDQDQVAVQVESQQQQPAQEPDVLSSPGFAASSVKNTLFDEVHSYSI